MENVKHVSIDSCHDCGKEIEVEKDELIGGKMLEYDSEGEKIKILKCDSCFEKDPSLKNYQGCEVYSRIVGYIRPVQQWNAGKRTEYSDREEYKENQK